jgi:hypothetical protein
LGIYTFAGEEHHEASERQVMLQLTLWPGLVAQWQRGLTQFFWLLATSQLVVDCVEVMPKIAYGYYRFLQIYI